MTTTGLKDDNTLSPMLFVTTDKMFVIPKDKVMVISRAAKELANYYEVILTKLQNTKIKTAYSPQEIEKMLEIADVLDRELREQEEIEEAESEYEDLDKKTIH